MCNFAHLHVHSEYSLLDGACRIKELISNAKRLNQSAVAITDHGVMYGVIDFYKEAKKNGIKPIVGCEVYVAPRTRFDKVYELDSSPYHLVLLCKGNVGYQNLINIVSKSWTEGFYNKPRVDYELLKNNSKDLIALSGCLAGEVAKLLEINNFQQAKQKALFYNDIFGEGNFYLELQDHGLKEQKHINPMLIELSKETGIPLVATNDCHYILKEDSKIHDVLLCIQTNHTIKDENRFEFSSDQFYLKSEEEMRALFPGIDEAINNTIEIAEKCNVEFEFGKTKLPHFDVPSGVGHFEYFKDKCYKGLYKNYGENPSRDIIDRLEYELNTINNMGYVDYYLIVHDFVRYAKSVGIAVGPGRGSGAGSLAAYCIGITGMDPIKYNLLFERFLNPERVSMPDFDIDFCYERRQEVIDYVIGKYGKDHVAQIITFGTMAARAAIRDVGRALGMSYSSVDLIAKLVPMELGMTIDTALVMSMDLREKYDTDLQVKELIDTAKKVEGMPRHASTHAAGVVITEQPVSCYVPLSKNDNSIVTQYTMTTLEELGLLKMDFLGLRNLTVLKDTEKMIRQSNPNFTLDNISHDKDVFDMISKGETEGIFQFESTGMRNVLMQLKPEHLEDLIAVISLYRPGPMESIPRYINNRHNVNNISYKHPLLFNILDVTYGCIVYQEQVMQIFRTLAGYSLGRADIVRRAMSKKKADVMMREREIFIYGLVNENGDVEVDGCIRRGVSEKVAYQIFDEMENFASYAFNKSHATAYAFISYQTAWLKCKYPHEFMAALLTSVLDNTTKIVTYIHECQRMNINVLPPHVNESNYNFTVCNNNIRFGLLAIKNLGNSFIRTLIREREVNGKFKSFYDFCKRVYGSDVNKRALEGLIKSGALDNLGASRKQMIMSIDNIMNDLSYNKRNNVEGQLGFFDNVQASDDMYSYSLPNVEEFKKNDLLYMEKQTIGLYLSGHPMDEFIDFYNDKRFDRISDMLQLDKESLYKDGDKVKVLAIVSNVKTRIVKNSTIAFITIEDIFGSIEMIVFSNVLEKYLPLLSEGNILEIHGHLNIREDSDLKLVCDKVSTIDLKASIDNKSEKVKRKGLYIKLSSNNCFEYERSKLLISIFQGYTPVYFFFEGSQKLMLAPKELWVSVNEPLLKELKKVIGKDNVVIV